MSYAMPYSAGGGYGFLAGLGGAAPTRLASGSNIVYTNDSINAVYGPKTLSNTEIGFQIKSLLSYLLDFIPSTFRCTISTNWSVIYNTITLSFTLQSDTDTNALQHAIESAIANVYGNGLSIGTGVLDLSGAIPLTASGTPTGSMSADSRGIEAIIGDPDQGDYDVIFSDGSAGIFDDMGRFYNGNQDGIASVGTSLNDAGQDDGYYATMKDGSEVYFDFQGNYVDTYIPSSVTPVVPTTNLNIPVKNNRNANIKDDDDSSGFSAQKVIDSLGLTSVVAGMGIGAGAALIVGGAILYLVMTKK